MENEDYPAIEVYYAVIKEYQRRGGRETDFLNLSSEIHTAFYNAKKEYPDEMGRFKFKRTINPYSLTLDTAKGFYLMNLAGNIEPKFVKDSKIEKIAKFIVGNLPKPLN